MLNKFKTYLKDKLKLSGTEKILLAVSGGIDSVVMLDLFARSRYLCGVAHCNFHLRGTDSDEDEKLVENLAKKYQFPFYKIDFNTQDYAKKQGISIEMAARKLRYEWFEQIRQANDYRFIAVAHHSDDVIETFFLNLIRGTGIRGLSGIKPVSGKIIRPLLFASRNEIVAYCTKHNLKYRDDYTNTDTNIKRNKLRIDIIPQFAEINPAYKENILKTIEISNDTHQILEEKLNRLKKSIIKTEKEIKYLDIKKLQNLEKPEFYLFELLYPYGYNASQIKDIIQSLSGISGKTFYSADYQLVKDRDFLILSPIRSNNQEQTVYLYENQTKAIINDQITLKIQFLQNTDNFTLLKDSKIAFLDKDKLKFPLKIRKWQKGDYFYPLGMNKKKKLSDFFIDNKFSKIDKENALVLVSSNDIVWLISHRIDNRYKLNPKTQNIMQISLEIL